MFQESKAAQIAAYFLHLRGGRMSHMKLLKLMYLADREAMKELGFPISSDNHVSMPHGPVLSQTYDCMNGNCFPVEGGWASWISDKENYEVSLNRNLESAEELDEVSPAEIEILDSIWEQFGHMKRWDLVEYTHSAMCPEWVDPQGSSYPIRPEDIYRAVGYQPEEANELAQELAEQRKMDQFLASL